MCHLIDGFVFDLDGTIYLGEAALPGAVEALADLRRRNKRLLFVSNKPLEPREAYAKKLTRLGIPTEAENVITSAYVLGHHLSQTAPHLRLYVIGEETLHHELRQFGLQIADELFEQDEKAVLITENIDAVVVAFDRTLNYRKLNTAYQALCRGARFFATNGDKTCPLPGGAIPDAGATIAALEKITGRQVELIAGKPSPLITQVALARLGVSPERCMMIGDRLETDIYMGQQAGMMTAVVLTGVANREAAAQMDQPPDLVLETLDELPELIR